MLDKHDGNAKGVTNLDDVLHELRGLGRIHAGGRLVEQQQLGVGGKRTNNLQTTLGAVRQRTGLLICQMLHIKDGEQLHGALMGGLLVLPIRRQTQHALKTGVALLVVQTDLNVVLHRHSVEQADVLESTGDAHAVDLIDRLARGVLTVEQDGAVRGLVHLGEQVEDRGLTGTIGANQAGDLGLADSQAKVVDCLKATELNAQVDALERRALAQIAIGNDGARRIRDHLALVELKFTGHRLPPPSWKQNGP